jgi:hypothetical protein
LPTPTLDAGTAMKLRHLLTVNVLFASFFGLTCAVVPRQLSQLYGLPLNTAGVWVTRLLGGSLLGLATLMWFGRGSPAVGTRRAVALALLIQDTVGLAASLSVQLSGQMAAIGWSNVALYGLLALGYTYFLVVEPGRA